MNGDAARGASADDERPCQYAGAYGSENHYGKNEEQFGNCVQGIVGHDAFPICQLQMQFLCSAAQVLAVAVAAKFNCLSDGFKFTNNVSAKVATFPHGKLHAVVRATVARLPHRGGIAVVYNGVTDAFAG